MTCQDVDQAKRRKMFVFRDGFGLTNDDLRDLAEQILRRDITSLKDLSDADLGRMLDGFELATLLVHLLAERGHDHLVTQVAGA
jgi:hypothetical protein